MDATICTCAGGIRSVLAISFSSAILRSVTRIERTAPSLVQVVGSRVRAERKSRGFTLDRIAAEAGISTRTLITVELAQASTSLTSLDRIARALDVPVVELVTDTPVRAIDAA